METSHHLQVPGAHERAMDIFWHRRDLRVADNRGLAHTAERAEEVVPVFIFDDSVLEYASPPRVAFMLDALAALQDAYNSLDSELLLAHGDPSTVLPALAKACSADRVVWNEDYSGLARNRDETVRNNLEGSEDTDIDVESVHDAVHHGPETIWTNAGDPYSVFTYYWKKWRDRDKEVPSPEPDSATVANSSTVAAVTEEIEAGRSALPPLAELGFNEPGASVQTAGTEAARERLAAFCAGPIYTYEDNRDYPAAEGTSRLSTDLKWGTIGVREVWAATVDSFEGIDESTEGAMENESTDAEQMRESVREFQSQLAWREFYMQVLYHNPSVVSDNFRSYENPIQWENDPELLSAWKAGETGYPIVDAGMNQLQSAAHMHNRVRMIVASFLTKDLLIDWRHGYEWFREKLADHDTANDSGGWQWAASTGTDAQPYFRIFNPMTQGERYDPDAEYIKRYVPALSDVDPDVIHEWTDLSTTERRRAAPEYPEPVVDHSHRRDAALAMYERARGEE